MDDYVDPLGVMERLAPGVLGYTVDMPDGTLNIPMIQAEREGNGDVGRYLESLPRDRRICFPCVISRRLQGMLERRGFVPSVEWADDFEEWVEVMARPAT